MILLKVNALDYIQVGGMALMGIFFWVCTLFDE